MEATLRKPRIKKQIAEMLPVKEKLSHNEAMAYTDMSVNTFKAFSLKYNLSVFCPVGKKTYYNKAEINQAIESSAIIRQIQHHG